MGIFLWRHSNMMKILLLLVVLVAAVTANATCKKEKIEIDLLKTALINVGQHHPQTKECADGDGFFCVAELAGTIAACIAAGLTVGAELVGCIAAAIGTGHDCFDCICWVLSYMGIDCGDPMMLIQ